MPAAALQRRLLAAPGHAAVHDPDHPVEAPAGEIALDIRDDRGIGSVARQGPAAHREAAARHRERQKQKSLAEAAALRDNGEVVRLIQSGEDPNKAGTVRPELLRNDAQVVTPLEAAVGIDRRDMLETLIENGGEITPEIEAELNGIAGAFEAKVERVALYVRNLLTTADAAASEADRLECLARSRRAAADGLKSYLLTQMDRLEKPKVETPLVKVRIQQNSRPAIAWPEHLPIPEAYQRVTVSLDGQKAYQDWKAGDLPADFIVQQGKHLRIS